MIVGYLIITGSGLLHTPLMSGMNALSGVTVLGSLRRDRSRDRIAPLAFGIHFRLSRNRPGDDQCRRRFRVTGRMLGDVRP